MGWPKYLKKSYSRKDLDKRVLKKVQLKHDREFLASLFVADGDVLSLRKDLGKEESVRLKKIVKEIKAGRGGIRLLPLISVALIVAAGFVFTLIFKDPLADRLMEKSLGELTGATVDVDGLHISLLKMEIRWERVQAADPENLDRNMAELGETVLKLNSLALLEKKLVVESIVSRGAAWDTVRETPGVLVLPDGEEKKGAGKDSDDSPFSGFRTEQTDMIAGAVSDPKAFVDSQWDSLKTPALASDLKDSYARSQEDRKSAVSSLKEETGSLVGEGQDFLNRDYGEYKNHPDQIPALLSEADGFYKKVEAGQAELQTELKAVQDLKTSLERDRKALATARGEDMARVKSLVSLPEGGVKGLLDSAVQSYLASLLGDKYYKIKKIAAFAEKYRTEGKEEDPEKGENGRTGRIVSFDTVHWPDLFLQNLLLSAGGGNFSWEAEAGDVAADPDQWDNPADLGFLWYQGEGRLEGKGVLDRRSEGDPSSGAFTFVGLPLSTDALSGLGIARAEGDTEGTADLTVDRGGNWSLNADLTVTDPRMEKSGGDMVADLLYSVLSGEDWNMVLAASGSGANMNFSLDWPLLDRVDDEVGSLLKEQSQAYLDSVEKELLDRYAGELGFLDNYQEELDLSEALIRGDLSSLDSTKKKVGDKISQVQKDASDQAAREAEQLLEKTGVGDAVKDATQSLPKLF